METTVRTDLGTLSGFPHILESSELIRRYSGKITAREWVCNWKSQRWVETGYRNIRLLTNEDRIRFGQSITSSTVGDLECRVASKKRMRIRGKTNASGRTYSSSVNVPPTASTAAAVLVTTVELAPVVSTVVVLPAAVVVVLDEAFATDLSL